MKKTLRIFVSYFFRSLSLLVILSIRCFGFFFRSRALVVYYDFDYCPLGFDMIWFFMGAELARREKRCQGIVVVFNLCQYRGKYREEAIQRFKWQFNNIALPAARLFPHITTYSVENSLVKAVCKIGAAWHIYPSHPLNPAVIRNKNAYERVHKKIFAVLPHIQRPWGIQASSIAKQYIQTWMNNYVGDKKLVVITLRRSSNNPKRNSNISEWTKFAKSCDLSEYFITFIMDTDTLFEGYPEELGNFHFFDSACWNIEIRLALYEMAYINLTTAAGPASLCYFDCFCKFLIFKMEVEGEPTASMELLRRLGFEKGENIPWATPFQKIVWAEDNYEIVREEFGFMVAKINKGFCEKVEAFQ